MTHPGRGGPSDSSSQPRGHEESTRRLSLPGPGEGRRRDVRDGLSNQRWDRPDAPWGPAPRKSPGEATAVIYLGKQEPDTSSGETGSGDGGGVVPIYFNPTIAAHPPSYTAKIVAIYGLTLAVYVTLFFMYGGRAAGNMENPLWRLATAMLLGSLSVALSGILVDDPKSAWAKRLTVAVYAGCVVAWLGIFGYSYQQLS